MKNGRNLFGVLCLVLLFGITFIGCNEIIDGTNHFQDTSWQFTDRVHNGEHRLTISFENTNWHLNVSSVINGVVDQGVSGGTYTFNGNTALLKSYWDSETFKAKISGDTLNINGNVYTKLE